MRIKKDYANRRKQPVNIVSSEPADAQKMGAGSSGARPTEKIIQQETAARARAGRQFVPNAGLRK